MGLFGLMGTGMGQARGSVEKVLIAADAGSLGVSLDHLNRTDVMLDFDIFRLPQPHCLQCSHPAQGTQDPVLQGAVILLPGIKCLQLPLTSALGRIGPTEQTRGWGKERWKGRGICNKEGPPCWEILWGPKNYTQVFSVSACLLT